LETPKEKLLEIAVRIKEMRQIAGYTVAQMAQKLRIAATLYTQYENGKTDLPFSFIHNCALALGVGINDLLEGYSTAKLTNYSITRKGAGRVTAKENGIEINSLVPRFRSRLAQPYHVTYTYSEAAQKKPIPLSVHGGQEFDYVLSGKLKIKIGEHIEELLPGDSIIYNSSTPHGMIAADGADCTFLAVVLSGEEEEKKSAHTASSAAHATDSKLISDKFVSAIEDEKGSLKKISFKNTAQFNFAFDIVDGLGKQKPNEPAMIHIGKDKTERIFTFQDMMRYSAQCANYFKSLGIKKGDKVMLVLKRHHQFWFAILALHKLGAIAIPATHLLKERDLVYRFNAAGISAVICTQDDGFPSRIDAAQAESPSLKTKISVGGADFEGWHNFDNELKLFSDVYTRTSDAPCGSDTLFMYFTSGTTGYPKLTVHNHTYPLGHYHTAKYWHCSRPGDVHLTISDTGWAKSFWGKLYGEWMCESTIFVYDLQKFDAAEILSMFKKYKIATFCAPPTMLRLMIKEDLSDYDLSSLRHMVTAGEALNPEVFNKFQEKTGIKIMEGFGQTETTLMIANLAGEGYKVGSMGKPVPLYDIALLDADGNEVGAGASGEVCIRIDKGRPCGLFTGYYNDDEANKRVLRGNYYCTGDIAWRDEDGFLWYVSRIDDVIKSSGYRIGPFEIESVIMELPYVLECGVSAEPDPERGQVVKASVVLTKDTKPSDKLKKEIQDYVKQKTAPYKYPRIVVFKDELPKTISGKIQRNKL